MISKDSFQDTDLMEPIAIVGLSLRFPGNANDLDGFWKLIVEARCVSQDFPTSRINVNGAYWSKASLGVTTPIRKGHFLGEDVITFDAPFFSLSAVEAASMDPQQRLLLEASYIALENAGIPISLVTGSKTSVYIGSFTDDYKTLYQKDVRDGAPYAATGITTTLNANRVSWFYNLTAPSVNVDTACSSSLVALDLACRGLRTGQAEMSIVGGINLLLAPDLFHILSELNMLSPEGRCYSFDARGNGYGRGEGVGMLVLKRLEQALQDGDTIRAVIRSTACNHNGYTPSITQPSRQAQIALIDECYAQAGLDKRRTVYIEAHGTGTPVGDPIEAEALGASFGENRLPGEHIYVGSVKANIGHLEGSSGIAGIIKAIAILERGLIPPVADLQKLNPMIDETRLGLQFPQYAVPWPREGLRRISVNSFSFGGSNAHAILDDAYHFLLEHELDGMAYEPRTETTGDCCLVRGALPVRITKQLQNPPSRSKRDFRYLVIPVSAADRTSVARTIKAYREYFNNITADVTTPDFLDALSHTLIRRRSWLPWRACAVVASETQLRDLDTLMSSPCESFTCPKIAFLFTGQGAQWPEMGQELQHYVVFRRHLEEANAYLQSIGCEWQLIEELLKPATTSRISEPRICQVLCTVIQMALVDLLADFKIRPNAVIGHSSGEIAAAYCYGAISARSAWRIAYLRGVYASALRETCAIPGGMLAVGLGPSEATAYLAQSHAERDALSIACYNSPCSVTISGDEKAIDILKTEFDRMGVFARKLRTGVAYHSKQMCEVADAYMGAIGAIEPGSTELTGPVMISTVSNRRVSPEVLQQAAYWADNLVSPVRFMQTFQQLCAKRETKVRDSSLSQDLDINICLEIGPHNTLQGPVRDILAAEGQAMTYLSTLQRGCSGLTTLLQTIGQLWCLGLSPEIMRVNHEGQESETMVFLADLPTYPWNHTRSYFHESRISKAHRLREEVRCDLLGEAAVDWNPLEARWRNFMKLSEHPWVEDHQINGTIIFPAAGMIAMAVEAAKQVFKGTRPIAGYELRDINLSAALAIPDHDRGIETQFFLRQHQASWSEFRLCALVEKRWEEICSGRIRVKYRSSTESGVGTTRVAREHLQDIQEKCSRIKGQDGMVVEVADFYSQLRDYGLEFGPSFQTLRTAYAADRESVAEVKIRHAAPECPYVIHPCTLDALLHMPMLFQLRNKEHEERRKSTVIPSKIRRIWLTAEGLASPIAGTFHATSTLVTETRLEIQVQSNALSPDGSQVLAELEGIHLRIDNSLLDMANPALLEEDGVWNLVWRPDVELMSGPEIDRWCVIEMKQQDKEPIQFYRQLAFLHYAHLKQIVRATSNGSITPQVPHLKQYIRWAQEQVTKFETKDIPHWEPSWEYSATHSGHLHQVEGWIEKINDEGKAHAVMARHLQQVLNSDIDPLELLFGSPLLNDVYAELSRNTNSFGSLARYLELYAHKYPNAAYLEIGAGTGGSTATVLRSLRGDDGNLASYRSFTFTDISESFFSSARAKFAQFPNLVFERLNIEEPVIDQGYAPDSYDVLIAANVLHATKDLAITLQNIQVLLRPGGQIDHS